jgi:hypothetical protein
MVRTGALEEGGAGGNCGTKFSQSNDQPWKRRDKVGVRENDRDSRSLACGISHLNPTLGLLTLNAVAICSFYPFYLHSRLHPRLLESGYTASGPLIRLDDVSNAAIYLTNYE